MQPTLLNDRPINAGLVFGATALLAITSSFTTGIPAVQAEDKVPTQQPEATGSVDHQPTISSRAQRRGQTPDYWAGSYWDAPKGDTFWHNLKPDSTATTVERSPRKRASTRKRR